MSLTLRFDALHILAASTAQRFGLHARWHEQSLLAHCFLALHDCGSPHPLPLRAPRPAARLIVYWSALLIVLAEKTLPRLHHWSRLPSLELLLFLLLFYNFQLMHCLLFDEVIGHLHLVFEITLVLFEVIIHLFRFHASHFFLKIIISIIRNFLQERKLYLNNAGLKKCYLNIFHKAFLFWKQRSRPCQEWSISPSWE